MEKQKVCIIGGGLTGLITSIALSKINLKIDLVGVHANQNFKSNRTTAISQENFNFLKQSKILDLSTNDFWCCSKMKLYTENKGKRISEIFDFNQVEDEDKKILYMLNNFKTKRYLLRKIKKDKFIQIKKQKKISNIFNSGILRSIRLNNKDKSKYNLIILCTGKNSNLSKKFFSKGIIEKSYNEISVTTTLSHAYTKNNTARQIFLNNGVIALLPISNTKTSVVWSVNRNYINKSKVKRNLFIKQNILFYANIFLKKIKSISKLEFKDLTLTVRNKYYRDRILLFGDALHTVHPLAGQGFNMILRDLSSLVKILRNKINLGLDIGSSDVLSEFSKEIKPGNIVYSLGIDLIKNIFSLKNESFKKLRNQVIGKMDKNKLIKNLFFSIADKGVKL